MKVPWGKKNTKITMAVLGLFVAVMCFDMPVYAAEIVTETEGSASVSDNSIAVPAVSDNSVPEAVEQVEEEPAVQPETTVAAEPVKEEIQEEVKAPVVIDPNGLQTGNYKTETLSDWSQILEALKTLKPEDLTNPDTAGKTLVLQLQNVESIPAEMKDALAASDGSGYNKVLQCNLKYGVVLAFNGAENNSGFTGIGNAKVRVESEERGKRSLATTVRFEEHKNLGTVAALQLNLPRCGKGTKVSVYAETISTDAAGNTVVGENVCIGTTKADEMGNVAVPIQSTANYMFVYRAEKE